MQNYSQVQPQIQAYTTPPKIVYNQNVMQTPPSPAQNQNVQTQNQNIAGANALSHIPLQQDVLSLSTKPDFKAPLNETQNQNIAPVDTKLNAQMPSPDIQTPSEIETTAQKAVEEKPLPSLNVGVVDAPNNASITPIMDDINSRANEIERQNLSQTAISDNENSTIPKTLGKKPMNAGKISAGLSLSALGLVLVMLIPKGISKIIKLIKHK